jgi:DNA-directed RNA polymerase omega subunit
LEADVAMAVMRDAPDSQFAYVVVVSRRARQLLVGARPLVDNPRSRKTTRIAEEEPQRGYLEYEAPMLEKDAAAEEESKRRK